VTRIYLDGASIPRFALHETDLEKPRWLETAYAWGHRISKEPALITALITALLFGFVVIKVFWIARGDIPTALGVFNSAGLASVIAGGLLSAFPLVSAVVFGVAMFELSESSAFRRTFPFIWCYTPVWVTGLVAAVSCFFLTPWPIMVAGAVLGFVSGIAVRAAPRAKKLLGNKHGWIGKAVRLGGIAILALLSLFLVLNPLLYVVWLPHETLTLAKPGRQQWVGYVLSDSNGWISLLRTNERRIYRFRSEDVTARVLCSTKPIPMPFVPDWFKSPSPLYKTLRPGASVTLPPCK
jgi:hypothetical protein